LPAAVQASHLGNIKQWTYQGGCTQWSATLTPWRLTGLEAPAVSEGRHREGRDCRAGVSWEDGGSEAGGGWEGGWLGRSWGSWEGAV